MELAGITPNIKPIRGGTTVQDSHLWDSLPQPLCRRPQLPGKLEFVPISMEKAVQVILNLISLYAEEQSYDKTHSQYS